MNMFIHIIKPALNHQTQQTFWSWLEFVQKGLESGQGPVLSPGLQRPWDRAAPTAAALAFREDSLLQTKVSGWFTAASRW